MYITGYWNSSFITVQPFIFRKKCQVIVPMLYHLPCYSVHELNCAQMLSCIYKNQCTAFNLQIQSAWKPLLIMFNKGSSLNYRCRVIHNMKITKLVRMFCCPLPLTYNTLKTAVFVQYFVSDWVQQCYSPSGESESFK